MTPYDDKASTSFGADALPRHHQLGGLVWNREEEEEEQRVRLVFTASRLARLLQSAYTYP